MQQEVVEILPTGRQGPLYPAVNTTVADDLATYGARASAAEVLTKLVHLEYSDMILGLESANERRCYKVTLSLIGWAQTWNQPWIFWFQYHRVKKLQKDTP